MLRIGICGASGTGKTTLANFITEEFDTPFIKSNSAALMEKYGVKDHKALITMSNLNPEQGRAYQNELLSQREEWLKTNTHFVMDRTPIDNIVYYLLQCSHSDTTESSRAYINKALELLKSYTHIIYLPVTYTTPENDGMRVTNYEYQKVTDMIFSHIYHSILDKASWREFKIAKLDFWNLEMRKAFTLNFLRPTE